MPSAVKTVAAEKETTIRVDVNGQNIDIPVNGVLYAHYQNQFKKHKPTTAQWMRHKTLQQLMRAAYLKGLEDAKNKK